MTEIVNAVQPFLQTALGVPVYPENGVPEDAVLPYATYTPVQTDWTDSTLMPVRIWDRSTNYIRLNALCDTLSASLGAYRIIPAADKGYVHLYRGNPWAQPQPTPKTDVKVMYINLAISTLIA